MTAAPIRFGQRQRLTSRLRELVRKYPKGVGLFKEFLQNADDAGASELNVVLDLREHPKDSLPNSQMRSLQGRSLIFVNDRVFTNEDWEKIQDIGNSGKAMDIAKTGRFGLGFNCVYNVTDLPMLLTGNRLGIFDPHASVVEGATSADPGAAWTLAALWENYPDLLRPFLDVGLNHGQTEYEGTIFRLPLRDQTMAGNSEVCSEPYKPEDFREMVSSVENHASELVMFLNSVRQFKLSKISRDGEWTDLVSVKTKNGDEIATVQSEIRNQISRPVTEVLEFARLIGDQIWFTKHELEITSQSETRVENWRRVRGLYGNDDLLETARDMCDFEEKAIPLAGAAIQLESNSRPGVLSCSLPLPTNSGIPFHIDGFFDLHDSRQDIFQDATTSGRKSKTRYEWNRLLLQHGCAEAAAELLTRVANETNNPIYDHWPRLESVSGERLVDVLPHQIYEALLSKDCILSGTEGVLAKPIEVKISPDAIQEPLLSAGVAIPNPPLPNHVVRGFNSTSCPIETILPGDVREFLRDNRFQDVNISEATRDCLTEKEWLLALLEYCLSDKDYDDFVDVPLALMCDGKLRKYDTNDPTWLYLGSDAEKNLLAGIPNLFLADEVAELGVERLPNVSSLGLNGLIEQLADVFISIEEDEYVEYDASANSIPSYDWLTEFYNYCADVANGERLRSLSSPYLSKLPLVPDTSGRLWGMCTAKTPIFIPARKQPQWLLDVLSIADVSIVSTAGELGKAIAKFKSAVGDTEIITLTPAVLVELVSSNAATMVDFMTSNDGTVSKFLEFATAGELSANTVRDLSDLPIFPLIGGGTTAIRDNVYQSTDFQPPKISTGVELLDTENGRWTFLYDQLGVKKMTRVRFVLDYMLEGFDDIGDDDQLTALVWLMENYYSLMNNIAEPSRSKFAAKIRTTNLIRCDDRELHSASELYHPECQDVLKLLGTVGHCPDSGIYATNDWLEFFVTLGMERHARPSDLIRAIDCLTVEPLSVQVANQIHRLVKFIECHWEKLHGQIVDGQLFSDALSERRWLPAISSCPPRIPSSLFTSPENRLFAPNELARHIDLDLGSSVQPVCLFPIAEPMAGAIGHVSPTIATVLEQFDNLVDGCLGIEAVSESEARILKKIYRFVGSAIDAPVDSVVSSKLSEKYSNVPCLIDSDNRTWAPEATFRAPVPYFLRLRRQIRFKEDSYEKCATALGRKQSPSVEDFRSFFEAYKELCDNDFVVPADREQLRDAYIHAANASQPNGLASSDVLSSDGYLRHPNTLLINDAPWLSSRAAEAGIYFLDDALGQKVATAFGVGKLSQVIAERIENFEECRDEQHVQRCKHLNRSIHSFWFGKGLLRLLPFDAHVRERFDLLKEFEVVPAANIQTVLSWDGEDLDGSEGETDFVYENNHLYATTMPDSVLRIHVAEAISRRLFDTLAFSNESYIPMMLAEHPENIDAVLTQLRVPDLPTGRTVAAIDGEEEFVDSTGDTDESSESDDTGKHSSSPTDASAKQSSPSNSNDQTIEAKGNCDALPKPAVSESTEPERSQRVRTENDPPKVRTGVNRRSSTPSPRSRRAVTYVGENESARRNGSSEESTHRNEVDRAAIERVEQHERTTRVPTVMHHFNRGYDIESRVGADDDVERFIEVKGLSGAWGDFGVKLTPAQVEFGAVKGDKHWLYVVEFALDTDRAIIHMIQNPVTKITDYRFDGGWKQLCTRTSDATKIKPEVYCRVKVANEGDGTVTKIMQCGQLMRLTIQLDGGSEVKRNYPNSSIIVIE